MKAAPGRQHRGRAAWRRGGPYRGWHWRWTRGASTCSAASLPARCGFAAAELEPRLFSFNSPSGARPSCDGLGQQEVFDARAWWLFPR